MRFVITCLVTISLLPFHTFSIPYQRRAVEPVTEIVSASPKTLANTADTKAAPPSSTTKIEAIHPDAPSEVKVSLVQRIKKAWKSDNPITSTIVQKTLDGIVASSKETWRKDSEALAREQQDFDDTQSLQLKKYIATQRADLMKVLDDVKTADSPLIAFLDAMDFHRSQGEALRRFKQVQGVEGYKFRVAQREKQERVDAVQKRIEGWMKGLSRTIGTGPKNSSPSNP